MGQNEIFSYLLAFMVLCCGFVDQISVINTARYALAIAEQGLHSTEGLFSSSHCPATEEAGSELEFGGGTVDTADPTWSKGSTAIWWIYVQQFKLGRKKEGGTFALMASILPSTH